MTIRDDLADLCMIEARIAALEDQRVGLRRRIQDHARAAYEAQGVATTYRAGNLGSAGLTVPKPKPVVVDGLAFLTFVEDRYGPSAIETIRTVRPEAHDQLLAECQVVEANASLVTPEGERVPGVTVTTREPFLSVRLSKEAKLGALIDLGVMAEIPSGQGEVVDSDRPAAGEGPAPMDTLDAAEMEAKHPESLAERPDPEELEDLAFEEMERWAECPGPLGDQQREAS